MYHYCDKISQIAPGCRNDTGLRRLRVVYLITLIFIGFNGYDGVQVFFHYCQSELECVIIA